MLPETLRDVITRLVAMAEWGDLDDPEHRAERDALISRARSLLLAETPPGRKCVNHCDCYPHAKGKR